MRPSALLGLLIILFASAVAAGQAPLPLRFVDGNGAPLANARLRVLCFTSQDTDTLLADRWLVTDAHGFSVTALPEACSHLAALRLLHTQPSGKPGRTAAYQVFSSSFAPGASSALPALGDVVLRDEWPLVLFDVAASLEWQPAVGDSFLAELRAGLRAASAYLYDLSEGQMAFGALRIDSDGASWQAADLRFRAANDYRPSARIGGIVTVRQTYSSPSSQIVTFAPGDVLFGRYWSGRSAADAQRGAWDQPNAYRTIVHEWGHYALFLYDSYRQMTVEGARETYCTCRDLPLLGRSANTCNGLSLDTAASAMSYHYSASEFWLEGAPPECANTDQARLHGASDWATLARWSTFQGLPQEWLRLPTTLDAGPTPALVDHLFAASPSAPSALFLPIVSGANNGPADQARTLPISFILDADLNALERFALAPQVYTFGERAIYQGTSDGARLGSGQLGALDLLGLRDEQLLVQLDRYGPSGGRYRYRGSSLSADPIQLSADLWQASVELRPQLDAEGIGALDLLLTSEQPLGAAPTVALCTPETGCGAAQVFRADGDVWQARLLPSAGGQLPSYAVLHIEAPGQGELLRWYLLGGGLGPAHIRGDAPLADGLLSVDGASDDPRAQLLFTPAANVDALRAPLPTDIVGIIGQPVDIAIASAAPISFSLNLAYNPDQIEALGIEAEQLRVLYFDPVAQAWLPVPVAAYSPAPVVDPVPTPLPTMTLTPEATITPLASEIAAPSPTITGTVFVTRTQVAQRGAKLHAEDEVGWFWIASHTLDRDGIYALAWATSP
jgi:hypothetical protein